MRGLQLRAIKKILARGLGGANPASAADLLATWRKATAEEEKRREKQSSRETRAWVTESSGVPSPAVERAPVKLVAAAKPSTVEEKVVAAATVEEKVTPHATYSPDDVTHCTSSHTNERDFQR